MRPAPASSTGAKSPDVETKVSEKRIRTLNEELIKFPESFTVHRKLRKPLERRTEILDEGPIEFGHAEAPRLRLAADRGHAHPR